MNILIRNSRLRCDIVMEKHTHTYTYLRITCIWLRLNRRHTKKTYADGDKNIGQHSRLQDQYLLVFGPFLVQNLFHFHGKTPAGQQVGELAEPSGLQFVHVGMMFRRQRRGNRSRARGGAAGSSRLARHRRRSNGE